MPTIGVSTLMLSSETKEQIYVTYLGLPSHVGHSSSMEIFC